MGMEQELGQIRDAALADIEQANPKGIDAYEGKTMTLEPQELYILGLER